MCYTASEQGVGGWTGGLDRSVSGCGGGDAKARSDSRKQSAGGCGTDCPIQMSYAALVVSHVICAEEGPAGSTAHQTDRTRGACGATQPQQHSTAQHKPAQDSTAQSSTAHNGTAQHRGRAADEPNHRRWQPGNQPNPLLHTFTHTISCHKQS